MAHYFKVPFNAATQRRVGRRAAGQKAASGRPGSAHRPARPGSTMTVACGTNIRVPAANKLSNGDVDDDEVDVATSDDVHAINKTA